jgi:hypothetical protein
MTDGQRQHRSGQRAPGADAAPDDQFAAGLAVTQEQVSDAYVQGAINGAIDGLDNSEYARAPRRPVDKSR